MSFFGKSQYDDWKILVIICFIGVCLVAFFGGWMFYNLNEGDLFNQSSSSVFPQKKIDKKILSEMIQKVEEKKTNFENLKTNKPVVSDPSM